MIRERTVLAACSTSTVYKTTQSWTKEADRTLCHLLPLYFTLPKLRSIALTSALGAAFVLVQPKLHSILVSGLVNFLQAKRVPKNNKFSTKNLNIACNSGILNKTKTKRFRIVLHSHYNVQKYGKFSKKSTTRHTRSWKRTPNYSVWTYSHYSKYTYEEQKAKEGGLIVSILQLFMYSFESALKKKQPTSHTSHIGTWQPTLSLSFYTTFLHIM